LGLRSGEGEREAREGERILGSRRSARDRASLNEERGEGRERLRKIKRGKEIENR
jgi:hypothetical protein